LPKKFILVKVWITHSPVSNSPSWKYTFGRNWNVIFVPKGVLWKSQDEASLPTSGNSGSDKF